MGRQKGGKGSRERGMKRKRKGSKGDGKVRVRKGMVRNGKGAVTRFMTFQSRVSVRSWKNKSHSLSFSLTLEQYRVG